ncbi:hypothetical protein [Halolamina sp. C58]|uniref:hypothetical protein n=1 Tax=Halolamina sp. C58 TaxID=3421640 RepID=UPI003EBA9B70
MNTTKLLTVLVAALVVSAGAGAVTATDAENSAEASDTTVEASYDNGTVTLSVAQNGTGVENVSVEANGEDVGETDANGTLTFETDATEELELELEGDGIDHEVEYVIEDGELVREDDEEEPELAADVSYDNGTVDLTVTQNGSAVENASVTANGEDVGTTDANGTLTFETNASEELEIEITAGEQELELEYTIEDGELVEESDDEAGPDENASDRAKNVFAVIQNWLDGDREGNLGQLIQEQLGNGNDEAPGNSGEAPGNSGDAPGNSDEAPGQADDDEAPGNSGDAPGQADDESDDESETEADDDDDEDDDDDDDDDEDDDDDDDDDEDDDDDDANPGNGNGNGNN